MNKFALGAVALLVFGAAGASSLKLDRVEGDSRIYKGRVQLSGEVVRNTDKETVDQFGDYVCFVVKGESARLIPRDDDNRAPWFCFSNEEAAFKALRLPAQARKGSCGYRVPAEIVVTDYVVAMLESAVADNARLLTVKSRGTLKDIPCR
ncbi:MAG: hypothetical protein JNJ71_12705 [Rubrivivax sp.]|nr:hypothetical protein [Rubrivivax sp.]